MGSDNNSALESRFRFLKNQLSDLGYKYEFAPDSLPLLEALVADLIQTSDALKHYKELSQKCLQACQELETFVDAYKKDNARLVIELNSLHLNTISDKSTYEKRILDLESEIQALESKSATRGKQCLKSNIIRGKHRGCRETDSTKILSCHNAASKCDYCTKSIQNKDNEIKQLHSEILRLNNLLSGGRPIDVLCTHGQKRKNIDDCCVSKNSSALHHLLDALHGQHEAKCAAVNVMELCDKSVDQQCHKLHNKIIELETTCKNLENVKAQLHTELDSLRQSNQNLEHINKKLDQDVTELTKLNQESRAERIDKEKQLIETNKKLEHELLELKRASQEKSAENSDIQIQYKKCLAEKKHLSNRVHELNAIERDLTIEVSRLSNVNAIHKRHILELENKLLDVHQSKQKEGLTSKFDLLVSKKPLEKRCTLSRSKIGKSNDVGNVATNSKVTENKLLPLISEIRDKYQKQLDNIQGNDNDLLSFIKRLEEETNISVESSKAVQRQLESQLESAIKRLELVERLKNDAERELCVVRDKNIILEEQIAYKESRISHFEQVTANLQKQVDSPSTNTIRSSEEIFRKSALELERLRNQVRDLEKVKDGLQLDNRKLQNELATLTQDYLSCKKEVEKSKKETQDMRIQTHDYIAKVRAAEETLQQKDKERSEMLDHFRTLTIEATQLESNNHSLESEARSTRNALRNAESKIVDLEHLIQNKDALISGYEEQLSELTKTIASLESQLANLTNQRDRFKTCLDSCEELRSQMDTERDTLSSTVSSIKISNKKSEKELLKLQSENRCLQEQVANEKINVATLEKLLSETRKGTIKHDISVSELQEEIRGLKANIKCLQESLENLGKKLRQSQHEATDYQRQVVQLNRELTNLQFERIRNSPRDNINYSTL